PLKKEITFTPIISKNIKYIGLAFIISEIVSLLLSIYFINSYGLIQFKLPTEDRNLSQVIKYSFNPTLDFDFTFFIMGLSLLALAFLLKKGNEIKEENDLTI
ncbi:MAG TPA: hypothetical protein DEG69_05625, partial [Flavobacteriaceae bacterium]|nr:hypothetical protein [Flavobacteriaceae bacterium]